LTVYLRGALALAALVAAAWLTLSFRSARLEQQAAHASVARKTSPAAYRQALHQVRLAREWQPDSGPELVEWGLQLRNGHRDEANALLGQLLAREPQNAEAWFYLSVSARDSRAGRAARRRFVALNGG
jgi:hypothetical protein